MAVALFRKWLYQQRSPGVVHRLERHKSGVLLTLLITPLLILAYIYWLLPWASSEIALRIPTTAEQKLGEHSLEWLQQSGFKPSALPAERQEAIQQLFLQVMPPANAAGTHTAQTGIDDRADDSQCLYVT